MIRSTTYNKWKSGLDDEQTDFILKDYFKSHPSYDEKKDALIDRYKVKKKINTIPRFLLK